MPAASDSPPGRWNRFVVRARLPIIAVWFAAAAGATLWLPSIDEAQVGALGDLVPADSRAVETEKRAREVFGLPLLSRTLVVARDPAGLDRDRRLKALRFLADLSTTDREPFQNVLAVAPLSNTVRFFKTRETGTALLAYLFISPEIGQGGQTGIASVMANRLEADLPGSEAHVSGAVSARLERGRLIKDRLPVVELVTVILVAVLTAVAFRSALVPLVGLVAVAITYLIAVRILSAVGSAAGVSVPSEIEPVIVALIFGLVTDYLIFQVARYRQHLGADGESREATSKTITELTPVVLAAGLMVAGAALSLLAAELGFLQAFGPGLAIAVLVAVAVSATFVPAVLSLAGERVLWPGGRRRPSRHQQGLVRWAAQRPVAALVAVLIVLGACATGLLTLRTGNDLYSALPPENESRQGFESAAAAFAPGVVGPTTVVVESASLSAVAARRFGEALEEQRGVAGVIGATDLPGQEDFGLFRTDDAARYLVVLRHPPLSAAAIRTLGRVRADAPQLLREAGLKGAEASFGGDTAISAEIVTGTSSALLRVVPIALAVVYLLLAALLRRFLVPLLLLGAGALSVAAALGLTAFWFQGVLGTAELTFFVPFAGAVLLLALGCDYSALIARQIYDEAEQRPLREAVISAGGRAAGAISTAGVILALSFAALALIPVASFGQFAFAMCAGLLIDTFLVRPLLVPALIVLAAGPRGKPRSSQGRRSEIDPV